MSAVVVGFVLSVANSHKGDKKSAQPRNNSRWSILGGTTHPGCDGFRRSRPRMDLLELVHHFFMQPSVSETIHDSEIAIDRNRNGVHLPSDPVPAVAHSVRYESDVRCNTVENSQA